MRGVVTAHGLSSKVKTTSFAPSGSVSGKDLRPTRGAAVVSMLRTRAVPSAPARPSQSTWALAAVSMIMTNRTSTPARLSIVRHLKARWTIGQILWRSSPAGNGSPSGPRHSDPNDSQRNTRCFAVIGSLRGQAAKFHGYLSRLLILSRVLLIHPKKAAVTSRVSVLDLPRRCIRLPYALASSSATSRLS